MQAIYELSSTVNGENSWTSTSKAIWYNSETKVWLIGSKNKIGGKSAGVYARGIPGKGPENTDNLWNYSNKGWKADKAKDIKLQCIKTNGNGGGLNVRTVGDSGPVPGT